MTVEIPTNAEVKTIGFHHNALDVIREMTDHNRRVATAFGETSPEFIKQVVSFNNVMSMLLAKGWGNTAYVTKDGERSLFVQEEGFVFGVIFFRDRRYDGAEVQPGDWSCHS